ncbi:MAG TPA: peptidylprolyl isomerase [Vicinamibacterales bacterium]|jgi:peptidyl-prolyl cis-trans isomerase B (cyclophilin B)|nr:peptidylprolyl isomerase [Vicinamibacterales bacterium]
MTRAIVLLACLLMVTSPQRRAAPASQAGPFTTTLTAAQMANKQAVVQTSLGTFIIDLRPDLAPNQVGYFMKLANDGSYKGTIFHRIIHRGIIQGGDPLSKDPAKKAQYGTGGLGVLKAEHSQEPFTRGAIAAVIRPGLADSAGAQFFVCVSDQPALAGQYTIFGRVSEGMDVVEKISDASVDDKGAPTDRIEILDVAIRDTPPPEPVPFASDTVEQLATYRAVLDTSLGSITIGFMPDQAPETVRQFLRLAQAGVFDGTSFHRVVRGFAIQTGYLTTRGPLTEKQQNLVHALAPEFNGTKHVKGIVSMARGDDPASATTSFFVVTGDAPSLDGKYTAFGRVLDGMDVVEQIDAAPLSGESPVSRIDLLRVRVVRP